ncbi:hypothetical protein RB195_024183 [Necator americanus]|uniref:Uncharacterized protein n=1 Tax=Necator americanus TaxID=51031 RepID=A0ABR1EPJ1_NECAM
MQEASLRWHTETTECVIVHRQPFEILQFSLNSISLDSNLFLEILTSDAIDDRTPALNSIIPTLGGILDLVEEHREVMVHVEASILKPINCILTAGHVEFYDDVIILLQSLLQNYVSEPMWAVYNKLYEVFKNTDRQTILPFSDIAHVLHKYIVTDNESFLAFPDRMDAMIDMCQTTLQTLKEPVNYLVYPI